MGTQRASGSLYTKIENRIATIEFGHPAGNSFVSELLIRLEQAILEISEKKGVSMLLLRSEGDGAFCAGASLDEMAALQTEEEGTSFFNGFARVLIALRSFPLPVIGRVHGKVVGGGVGLVSCCDYVFATEAAAVKLSELSIGIAPLVIAPALERKIGLAAFSELALSPQEWKNAYWAGEKGLYSRVSGRAGEMDKDLEHFIAKLGATPVPALRELKKVLWAGTEDWATTMPDRARLSGILALSAESRKALAGFKK